MKMAIILVLAFVFISAYANPIESDIPAVEPEYLSKLLSQGKYEEFSALLNIPDPKFAKERKIEDSENAREEAMFHKELIQGDIMPYLRRPEEGRQIIKFDEYGGSEWRTRRVPYVINDDSANNNFTESQRQTIKNGINRWNEQMGDCIELVPRVDEEDYVFIFSGGGCWSYLGRVGKQQAMSLQHNGCLYQGTIIHEFEHAVGVHHEQNRLDRDNYVDVLWDNIPKSWHDQYKKTDSRYFRDVLQYDYYSIMHYPVRAPGSGKRAFDFKQNGVNERRVGNGNDFTAEDMAKLRQSYKC